LLVLQTHYRRQMEIGGKELSDAGKAIARLDALARRARVEGIGEGKVGEIAPFRAVMDDDFDTPAALAFIFELVRDAHVALDSGDREGAANLVATVRELAGALGIEIGADEPEADAEIDALVADREAARKRKDFAESDRIRDELAAKGVVIEDTPNGPVWRRA
jgi:cysteinyl-tRNA synthetase